MTDVGRHRHSKEMIEPDRPLSLGWPEAYGSVGVTRRIEKLAGLWPLEGHRMIDVGCGNGSYTTELADGYDEVYGIEVEQQRLDDFVAHVAERPDRDKYHLEHMSAEAMTYPDAYFDLAVAIEVIEHIVDLEAAVREIARVVKPGGAFLITAPNRWFPIETHSFHIRGKKYRSQLWPGVPWIKPLHRRISSARNFRPHDLRALLEPVGFQERGIDYLMPPFEHARVGDYLRPVTDRLERTRAKTFGVSVIAAFERLP